MTKIVYYFFRSLLGAYLILLGIKGLSDINANKSTLTNTIDLFEKNILIPYNIPTNLHLLRQHPYEILYFENLSILYGGFLMFFGFSLSKAFVMIGFLIEFIFMNNIYFYTDEKTVINFSLLLSLLGGVLHIK
jgi:hypothetical protein